MKNTSTSLHEKKAGWCQWTLILIFCVDVHMGLNPSTWAWPSPPLRVDVINGWPLKSTSHHTSKIQYLYNDQSLLGQKGDIYSPITHEYMSPKRETYTHPNSTSQFGKSSSSDKLSQGWEVSTENSVCYGHIKSVVLRVQTPKKTHNIFWLYPRHLDQLVQPSDATRTKWRVLLLLPNWKSEMGR